MNLRNTNEQKRAFSLVFLIIAVLLGCFTTAELIQIAGGAVNDPEIPDETLAQLIPDDEKVQQYLNKYQAKAEELISNNRFVPPPSGPEPPGDCTAIFGDEARIGERWVSVGDRVGEAEVIEIAPTRVTLELDGRRITRSPVLVVENSRQDSRNSRSFTRGREAQGGNQGRGGRGPDRTNRASSEFSPRVYRFDGSSGRSFDLSEASWQDATIDISFDGAEFRTIETDFGSISIGTIGGPGDGPVRGSFNVIRATPDAIRR